MIALRADIHNAAWATFSLYTVGGQRKAGVRGYR